MGPPLRMCSCTSDVLPNYHDRLWVHDGRDRSPMVWWAQGRYPSESTAACAGDLVVTGSRLPAWLAYLALVSACRRLALQERCEGWISLRRSIRMRSAGSDANAPRDSTWSAENDCDV